MDMWILYFEQYWLTYTPVLERQLCFTCATTESLLSLLIFMNGSALHNIEQKLVYSFISVWNGLGSLLTNGWLADNKNNTVSTESISHYWFWSMSEQIAGDDKEVKWFPRVSKMTNSAMHTNTQSIKWWWCIIIWIIYSIDWISIVKSAILDYNRFGQVPQYHSKKYRNRRIDKFINCVCVQKLVSPLFIWKLREKHRLHFVQCEYTKVYGRMTHFIYTNVITTCGLIHL